MHIANNFVVCTSHSSVALGDCGFGPLTLYMTFLLLYVVDNFDDLCNLEWQSENALGPWPFNSKLTCLPCYTGWFFAHAWERASCFHFTLHRGFMASHMTWVLVNIPNKIFPFIMYLIAQSARCCSVSRFIQRGEKGESDTQPPNADTE